MCENFLAVGACHIDAFQDHHFFQSFSASFVVQGIWLRPPQRCHHPQRPDVAPHVLPRCLLRWLFELAIDRDHDPGTKRIGGAFKNLLWFRTLLDGTPLSVLLRGLHAPHDHSPRPENFLISCGHCDEGIASFWISVGRMFDSFDSWFLFCFAALLVIFEESEVSERQELQSLVSKWRADDTEAWASLVPLIPKLCYHPFCLKQISKVNRYWVPQRGVSGLWFRPIAGYIMLTSYRVMR